MGADISWRQKGADVSLDQVLCFTTVHNVCKQLHMEERWKRVSFAIACRSASQEVCVCACVFSCVEGCAFD